MEVRPAIPSDALSIAEIDVESWKQAYHGLIAGSILDSRTVDSRMKHWASAIESRKPHLLVAETNSIVVGWIAFGLSRDKDASPQTGEIEAIYTHPDYWRQGIGKALLSRALHSFSGQQFSRITLWVLSGNIRAAGFYRAQGFQMDSCPPKVSKRGDQVLEEIRYAIELG